MERIIEENSSCLSFENKLPSLPPSDDIELETDESKNLPTIKSSLKDDSRSVNDLAGDSNSDGEETEKTSEMMTKDWLTKFKLSKESETKLELSKEINPLSPEQVPSNSVDLPVPVQENKNVKKRTAKPVLSFQERYEQKKRQSQVQGSPEPVDNSKSVASPSNSNSASEPQNYSHNLIDNASISNERALVQCKVPPEEIKINNGQHQNFTEKEVPLYRRPKDLKKSEDQEILMRDDEMHQIIDKASSTLNTLSLQCIRDLTIEDMVTRDWNYLKMKAIKETRKSISVKNINLKSKLKEEFELTSNNYERLWEYLHSYIVSPFEQAFNNNICLPNDQFEQQVEKCRKFGSEKISEKLRPLLLNKVEEFIVDYRTRNNIIQELELKFVQLILSKAGGYYSQEMSSILNPHYCDSKKLQEWHDKIFQETVQSFLEACAFKNSYWANQYVQLLQEEIIQIQRDFIVKNDDKKIVLQDDIMKFMQESKQFYQNKIQNFLRGSSNSQEFRKIDKISREEALNLFDKGTANVKSKDVVESVKSTLINCLNDEFNKKLAMLTQKQENEKRQQQQQSVNHKQNQQSPLTRSKVTLQELGTTSIAVHIGLYTTKMGLVTTSDDLRVLAEVQNCVLFDGLRMVANKGDDIQHRRKIPFCGDLMKHDIGYHYWIHGVRGNSWWFRLEDLMSFILATLKWEAELELKLNISDCLIVVPQSLNNGQRQAVKDGAILAGFNLVDLINDTSAMALSYVMMKKEKDPMSSQIITANLFEGYLDAASFKIGSNGSIEFLAMSGDFFIDTSNWYITDFLTLGFARLLRDTASLSSRAKKIFTMKELRAEDNSPSFLAIPDELYDTIQSQAPKKGKKVKVDSNYALMGASYLLCIHSQGADNKVYDKWLKLTKCDLQFKTLKDNLLVGFKNSKNNQEKGVNLFAQTMKKKQEDYFLKSQRSFHEKKMEVVKILENWRSQIKSPNYDETLKMGIISHIDALHSRIRDPILKSDELVEIKSNATQFYENLVGN